MSLTGTGRVIIQGDPARPAKLYIYVPLEVARDSQNPFRHGAPVNLRVERDSLVVSAFFCERCGRHLAEQKKLARHEESCQTGREVTR